MKFIGSITEGTLRDIERQLTALYSVACEYKLELLRDGFGDVTGLNDMAIRETDEAYMKKLNDIRNLEEV